MFATTSRKVLVPFATLVAAGAVAVGSGATFTSESDSTVSVTSGTLLHDNTQDGVTLTLDNIVPGDTMTGTVVIENTGDLDSELELKAAVGDNTFSDFLKLTITADDDTADAVAPVPVYATQAFPRADVVIQTPFAFAVGDEITYAFTVTLVNDEEGDAEEQNVDQGKDANATFTWTQTQLDGGELDENWEEPAPVVE